MALELSGEANAANRLALKTALELDEVTNAALAAKQPAEEGKGLSEANFTNTEKTKLAGIEEDATANSADSVLVDRANHTGTQEIATVAGLETALANRIEKMIDLETAPYATITSISVLFPGGTEPVVLIPATLPLTGDPYEDVDGRTPYTEDGSFEDGSFYNNRINYSALANQWVMTLDSGESVIGWDSHRADLTAVGVASWPWTSLLEPEVPQITPTFATDAPGVAGQEYRVPIGGGYYNHYRKMPDNSILPLGTFNTEGVSAQTVIRHMVAGSPVLPIAGDLHGFGDSQTYGFNASGNAYTTASRLNPEHRWLNILASSNGRELDVLNYGIPGAKISGVDASQSIWNATGQLPWDWTGVAVGMLGYNNADSGTTSDAYFAVMEQAFRAFAARFLIDDYAGMGAAGWGHDGSSGGTIHDFTTDGTDDSAAVSSGEAIRGMPFYYGDPDGARRQVLLDAGESAAWTVTGMRAIGVFLETTNSGGSYSVMVNGVERAAGSTDYDNLGGNDSSGYRYPMVVWLEGLPHSAQIQIRSTSGTVRLQGYGWVSKATDFSDRLAILAGPTADNLADHPLPVLRELCERMKAAVACFPDYPIYLADAFTPWDNRVGAEPNDLSHFTPAGNQIIADAFGRSGKEIRAAAIPRRNRFDLVAQSMLEMLDVHNITLDHANWETTIVGSALITTPSYGITLRCNNTAGASILARANPNGGSALMAFQGEDYSQIYWNKRMRLVCEFNVSYTSADSEFRIQFGRLYNSSTPGPLDQRGVGILIENLSVKIEVHDGTDLTVSGAVAALTTRVINRCIIDLDGEGNVVVTLNDKVIHEGSGAPNDVGSNNHNGIDLVASNGSDNEYAILGVTRLLAAKMPND